jgi:hypothetical protein
MLDANMGTCEVVAREHHIDCHTNLECAAFFGDLKHILKNQKPKDRHYEFKSNILEKLTDFVELPN